MQVGTLNSWSEKQKTVYIEAPSSKQMAFPAWPNRAIENFLNTTFS